MKNRRAVSILWIALVLCAGVCCGPLLAQQAEDPLAIPEVTRDKVICFALYTVHNNILKLNAQLYPLKDGEDRFCRLEVRKNGLWEEVAKSDVVERGWTCLLRVENWDSTQDWDYRVCHGSKAKYGGVIKHDPVERQQIVVAAFTGNSIYPGDGGYIPPTDIIQNVKKIRPDLLFFSGSPVYDPHNHYVYWLRFGRDFGEVIRNIPTVTIPDSHDGGHAAPVEYIKEVERAQMSHLPDPYDPTPIEGGIGAYYTSLTIAGVSFAIIEDHKFKSRPEKLVPQTGPRPNLIVDPNYDPKSLDVSGAELLGERQLKFLDAWTQDWRGCDMKVVLSETTFANGAHLYGTLDNRVYADLDSNGWPQTARNKALAVMRKGFAFHIAGGQHLGAIIHHGIDDWNGACYSFCVPPIANRDLRWWVPLEEGKNREPGMPPYLGEFTDGFENKITVLAAANPTPQESQGKLTTQAAGFGVVRFDTHWRHILMECWPRNVDVTDPKAKQYLGWPRQIRQENNYGEKVFGYLPTIQVVQGMDHPMFQVIDESNGEILYTIRTNSDAYRPMVFKDGSYTIKVGDIGTDKVHVWPNMEPLPRGRGLLIQTRF